MSPKNMVARELYERFVKSFMDLMVLNVLKGRENGNPPCGHEIRVLIQKESRVLISSGTIYSLLYSMERDGLVKGTMTTEKRVYRLTGKGKEKLGKISESSDKIVLLIKSILSK